MFARMCPRCVHIEGHEIERGGSTSHWVIDCQWKIPRLPWQRVVEVDQPYHPLSSGRVCLSKKRSITICNSFAKRGQGYQCIWSDSLAIGSTKPGEITGIHL